MKKLVLAAALFAAMGFGFAKEALSLNDLKLISQENLSKISTKVDKSDVFMTCVVTITATNSIGMVVAQWNEYYLVDDWGFSECNKIGRRRINELGGGN